MIGLRLLQDRLGQTARRLEQWQREDALRAARLLDAAARSAEPGMRDAFLSSIRKLRLAVQEAALADALASGGSAETILDLIPWNDVAAEPLRRAWQAILLDLVAEASGIALSVLPEAVTGNLQASGQRAADWAQQNVAHLVTGITDSQRVAIRETVARVYHGPEELRLTPAQAAKTIRSTVGLTPKLTDAVVSFQGDLVADGVALPRAQAQAGKYAEKLRAYRADMIARTETVTAANQAQQATWHDAAAEGLISVQNSVRVWHVIDDDRLDLLVCAPMDEQRVSLNQPFVTGDGRYVYTPAAHPGCRCYLSIDVQGVTP